LKILNQVLISGARAVNRKINHFVTDPIKEQVSVRKKWTSKLSAYVLGAPAKVPKHRHFAMVATDDKALGFRDL